MCEILGVIPPCGPNVPGVAEIWWCEESLVTGIPAVTSNTIVIASNITAPPFLKLQTIPEDTVFNDEMMGEQDSAHFMRQVDGIVKGMDADVEYAISRATGARAIVIVKLSDGTMRLVGDKTNPAYLVVSKSTSGKKGSTDKRGTTISIKSTGHSTKAPFYTGAIPD
jgi:hypothetical protein